MKIKIMECSWDKNLENKTLEVQKITSKGPKPPKWFLQYMEQFEIRLEQKLEQKLDQKLEQKLDQKMKQMFKEFAEINNLKMPNWK